MEINSDEVKTLLEVFEELYLQSLKGDPLSEDIRLLKNRILEAYPNIRCPSCGRDNTGISSHACL